MCKKEKTILIHHSVVERFIIMSEAHAPQFTHTHTQFEQNTPIHVKI